MSKASGALLKTAGVNKREGRGSEKSCCGW